jgi:hypothetical protein
MLGIYNNPWEHIWTLCCDELNNLVKERKAIAKKENAGRICTIRCPAGFW